MNNNIQENQEESNQYLNNLLNQDGNNNVFNTSINNQSMLNNS